MPGNVFLPLNCVVEHPWDPTQPHHHPELSAPSTAPPSGSPWGLWARKRRRRMNDGVPGPIPAAARHEGDEAVCTVPFAELELAHGEAVAPAAGVTVRGEDLLLVLLRLDVLLPLLLAVAVLPAEPAVVAHLTGAERGQRAGQGVNIHSHRPSPHRHCLSPCHCTTSHTSLPHHLQGTTLPRRGSRGDALPRWQPTAQSRAQRTRQLRSLLKTQAS